MGSTFSKKRARSDLNRIQSIHRNLNYNPKDNATVTVTHILSNWYREIHCITGITQIIQKYVGEDFGQIWSYKDTIKVVVVGEGAIGKTCMLLTQTRGYFPDEFLPTVFDNCTMHKRVGSYYVSIDLRDTAGQEDWDRLRPLSYFNTDVFILCFSISHQYSRENIISKWIPEIRGKGPYYKNDEWDFEAPIILCGTKIDLRQLHDGRFREEIVERTFGDELAKEIGAVEYVECSAKEMNGLDHVFERAAIAAIMHKEQKKLNEKGGSMKKRDRKKT